MQRGFHRRRFARIVASHCPPTDRLEPDSSFSVLRLFGPKSTGLHCGKVNLVRRMERCHHDFLAEAEQRPPSSSTVSGRYPARLKSTNLRWLGSEARQARLWTLIRAGAHTVMGCIAAIKGLPEEARRHHQIAVQHDAGVQARYNYSVSLALLAENVEALRVATNALERAPDMPELLDQTIILALANGRFGQAADLCTRWESLFRIALMSSLQVQVFSPPRSAPVSSAKTVRRKCLKFRVPSKGPKRSEGLTGHSFGMTLKIHLASCSNGACSRRPHKQPK